VPAGIVFRLEQDDALASIRALLKRSGTLVCKPVDGTHGHGVGLGLERPEDVVAHARRFAPRYAEWVAEEQRAGTDLRLQAIGGQLFAACVRVPGGVVGDGVRDIRALATERDAAVRAQNPNNALALDDEARALLRQAGFSETSVPQPGQRVRLRRVANMAQGARALDVGAVLHAGWGELITRLSAALELSVFAVDAMVPDPALAPAQGAVLEVNARPEWLHHTFSEGRTHDVAGALLADALPGLECREASSRLPRG
jgi:cyanophycin synthetase